MVRTSTYDTHRQAGGFLVSLLVMLLLLSLAAALLFGFGAQQLDKREAAARAEAQTAIGFSEKITQLSLSSSESTNESSPDASSPSSNANTQAKLSALIKQLENPLSALFKLERQPILFKQFLPSQFQPKTSLPLTTNLSPHWQKLKQSYSQYQQVQPSDQAFQQLRKQSLLALAAIREDLQSLKANVNNSAADNALINDSLMAQQDIATQLSQAPAQLMQENTIEARTLLAPSVKALLNGKLGKSHNEMLRTLLVLAQRLDRAPSELRALAPKATETDELKNQMHSNAKQLTNTLRSLLDTYSNRPLPSIWSLLEKGLLPAVALLLALCFIPLLRRKKHQPAPTATAEPSLSKANTSQQVAANGSTTEIKQPFESADDIAQLVPTEEPHHLEEARVTTSNSDPDSLLQELLTSNELNTVYAEPVGCDDQTMLIVKALNARSMRISELEEHVSRSTTSPQQSEALLATIATLRGKIDLLAVNDNTTAPFLSTNGDSPNTQSELNQIVTRLKRVSEAAGRIGESVNSLKDSIGQMNILALNASIQASVAGEAGQGFNIVVDEVQRLIERASGASHQIESMNKVIRADANQAGKALSGVPKSDIAEQASQPSAGQTTIEECKALLRSLETELEKAFTPVNQQGD